MPSKLPVLVVLAAAVLLFATGCDNSRSCNNCNGSGKVTLVDSWSGRQATVACPRCNGTGEISARGKDTQTRGPLKSLRGLLESWGVPSGVAIGAVIALIIYLDYKRNRDIEEERKNKD